MFFHLPNFEGGGGISMVFLTAKLYLSMEKLLQDVVKFHSIYHNYTLWFLRILGLFCFPNFRREKSTSSKNRSKSHRVKQLGGLKRVPSSPHAKHQALLAPRSNNHRKTCPHCGVGIHSMQGGLGEVPQSHQLFLKWRDISRSPINGSFFFFFSGVSIHDC